MLGHTLIMKFIIDGDGADLKDYAILAEHIYSSLNVDIDLIYFGGDENDKRGKGYKYKRKGSRDKIEQAFGKTNVSLSFDGKGINSPDDMFHSLCGLSFSFHKAGDLRFIEDYAEMTCIVDCKAIENMDFMSVFALLADLVIKSHSIYSAISFIYPIKEYPEFFAIGVVPSREESKIIRNIAQWSSGQPLEARTRKLRMVSTYNIIQFNNDVYAALSEILSQNDIYKTQNHIFFKVNEGLAIEDHILTDVYKRIHKVLFDMNIVNECKFLEYLG
jgi:hypothetical protein